MKCIMVKALVIFLVGCATVPVMSQTSDLARVEYTYFPQSSSDNSFRRFRALLNFPIKLNDNGSYLVPGIEYRNVNLQLDDTFPFDKKDMDRFQSMRADLGYTFKMQNDWRFGAKAGAIIASNFENGEIDPEDILFSGAVYFIKDKKGEGIPKPWRLILGLQYATTAGRPFPLPIVNYFRRLNEKWSHTLGVPKTNVKYYANDKNVFQAFVTLDGFFSNIQNNRTFLDQSGQTQTAENVSMTVVLGGIGYELFFTKHLLLYIYGGHTILNDIRLRNEDREDVFTLNDTNTFYIRSGIKFKI